MKANRILIIALIVMVVLNLSTLFFLWKGHKLNTSERIHRKDQNELAFIKRKLQLNDKQIALFKSERQAHFGRIRPLESELRQSKKRLILDQVNGGENNNFAGQLASIGQLHGEIDSLTVIHFTKLRSYCNDNQVEQFDDLLDKIIQRKFENNDRPKGMRSRDRKE